MDPIDQALARLRAADPLERAGLRPDDGPLHTALRAPRASALAVDGQDIATDVHAVLDRMGDFTDAVRSGAWTGHTGERIRAVVNIGIGGSDLGPVMAYEALRAYADRHRRFGG